MLPSLHGIRLKLQRAYQQLDALKEEIGTFLRGDVYEPTLKFNRIRGATEAPCVIDFTIRMIVKKTCPPMWSILIGEIIHNLRSALDHLVWQLVIHASGAPPGPKDRTQFPIYLDPGKFDVDSLKMLKGVSRNATALIKALEPFSTGEGVQSPLLHLNKLSNIDKHSMLHLTGGTLQTFDFTFPPVINPGRITKNIREKGAFEHNTIIVEGRMFSNLPMFGTKPVKVDAKIAFDIVFDPRTPLVGEWSVLGTLLDAADRSRDCIRKIGLDILSLDLGTEGLSLP